MFKLLVSLIVLSSLLLGTSAVDCGAATSTASATCAVASAAAGVLGLIVCAGTAGLGCAAVAAGGAVTALCGAVAGTIDCGGDDLSAENQKIIISYLEDIEEDVRDLSNRVELGFYENKYDSYINKIISATGRYQQDIVKKTIGDKTARYGNNMMIKEYVDDILGDGAYDVRGALTVIDGMISGRQGITRSPSVYELAWDLNICTEDLFNFMTNLIIEGTTTSFVAMEMRPQGGGVHQADKDQLTTRLEDNLNEFKSACAYYQKLDTSNLPRYSYDTNKLTFPAYWGDWGEVEYCSHGGYVTSFKLKVEGYQGSGDDTALNAICLGCSHGDEVCSSEGKHGNWGRRAKNDDDEDTCKEGFVAAKLSIEFRQGNSDDTSANDLRLICNDNGSKTFQTENGMPWGAWFTPFGQQNCRGGSVICGLKTRVEKEQGTCSTCDDTALNGVEFQCCEDIWS